MMAPWIRSECGAQWTDDRCTRLVPQIDEGQRDGGTDRQGEQMQRNKAPEDKLEALHRLCEPAISYIVECHDKQPNGQCEADADPL